MDQLIERVERVPGPFRAPRFARPDVVREPDAYMQWIVEHVSEPAGELRPLELPMIGPKAAPADRKWFVVVTEPSKERSVADDMRRDGIEPFAPEKRSFRRRAGSVEKLSVIARPLLPGYVFAGLAVGYVGPSRMIDYRNAVSVLPRPDGPLQVPGDEIVRLKRMEAAGEFDETLSGPRGWGKGHPLGSLAWIRPKAQIVVEDGPFAGRPASVQIVDAGRRRIKALVPLFGSEVAIELGFVQFRSAA